MKPNTKKADELITNAIAQEKKTISSIIREQKHERVARDRKPTVRSTCSGQARLPLFSQQENRKRDYETQCERNKKEAASSSREKEEFIVIV